MVRIIATGLLVLGGLAPARTADQSAHEIEPYFVEEVSFGSGDLTLAGLFHIPNRKGPHPAIVILHGSGSEGFVNQYRFMADWFARHGIATLFYYKRGTGPSDGDYTETPDSFDPLVQDALAAVAWLKSRHEINGSQIGYWGHSQGGWIGPLAASRSRAVAFVINVSGPTVEPWRQITYQRAQELVHKRGFSPEEGDAALELLRAAYDYWRTGNGYDAAAAVYARHAGSPWLREMGWGEALPRFEELGEKSRAFMRKHSLGYDPFPIYTELRAPLLVVYGAGDWFIPVEESITAYRKAVRLNPGADMTLKVFPESGHAIGRGGEGGRLFYAPGYPEYLITWLSARVEIQVRRRPEEGPPS